MSAADLMGRADEVQAAFLEGLRKGASGLFQRETDAQMWFGSLAYSRLAYGVYPPCPRCKSQIIEPDRHKVPKCSKCGHMRIMETTQKRERKAEPDEPRRLAAILRNPLDSIKQGDVRLRWGD